LPSAVAAIVELGKSKSKNDQLEQALAALRSSRLSVSTCTPAELQQHLARFAQTHGRTPLEWSGVIFRSAPGSLISHLAGCRQVHSTVIYEMLHIVRLIMSIP
jgi:hypothetical protein